MRNSVSQLDFVTRELRNSLGFNEKVKIPFNSVCDLVLDRHLYLYFENNEREEINSTHDFVSGKLSGDNSSDSKVEQEIDDSRAELKDNRF